MHLSAQEQATGEATYIDDLPHLESELYAGLVISERAHAKFTIDCSALDNMEVSNVADRCVNLHSYIPQHLFIMIIMSENYNTIRYMHVYYIPFAFCDEIYLL